MSGDPVLAWYNVLWHAAILSLPFIAVVKDYGIKHRIVWYLLLLLLPLYAGARGLRSDNFSGRFLTEFFYISIPYFVIGEIVFFVGAITKHGRVQSWITGYVFAVLSASAVFGVSAPIFSYFYQDGLSAVHPLSTQLFQLVVGMFGLFVIVAFINFCTAWFAVFVAFRLAQRLSIANVWYFATCGALTGLILSALIVIVRPRMWFEDWPDPPFYEQVMHNAYFAMLGGVVGGVVFWWVRGRYVRKRNSPSKT